MFLSNSYDYFEELFTSKADDQFFYKIINKLRRYELNGHKKPAIGERIGNYEMTGLYKLFFDLAGEVYKEDIVAKERSVRFDLVYTLFNTKIIEYCKKEFFDYSKTHENNTWKINENLFDNLFLSKEELQWGNHLLRKFNETYKRLSLAKMDSNQPYFRYEDAIIYLNSYIDLCKFIFKPNCLNEEEIRTQGIIEKMLNVDYLEKDGCFGLYSPFVVFSILRILNYIVTLPEHIDQAELSFECAETLNRRKHIVATYAMRSFSRFTTFYGNSCVVEYSRRNDKIICKEVDKVSSIDNVKPIRLFEKVSSYIYNYFKEHPFKTNCNFKISVYGFCSYMINEEFNPIEVDDLVYEIFSWFEDKRKSDSVLKNKNIENLELNYYLIGDENQRSSRKCIYEYTEDSEDNINYVRKCIFSVSSCNAKEYNTKHIANTLKESQLVFILDCPWMATEDFTVANEGDLQSYSQWIDRVSYVWDLEPKQHLLSCDNPLFDRVNLFASINDQFNRLAVSSVAKYGKIVRVMKDYMLNWIQRQIQEYRSLGEYKTVYIYNSSLRGMSYSNYANYPIIREESYSNKRFSIMRFSTRECNCVPLKNTQTQNRIYISLWNLVKYVDISFVFVGLKTFFEKYLNSALNVFESEEQRRLAIRRDIVSIMRNIVFVVEYVQGGKTVINNVKISIKLSEPVRKDFLNCDDPIFKKNEKKLLDFFKNIITGVVFKDSDGLGDNCIREAFERCLYNQAKTVNDIFFLHIYSKRKLEGTLSDMEIDFITNDIEKPDFTVDNLVPNFDSFSDKRAYQKLFDLFDIPSCNDFSIISILNQVDRIFVSNENQLLHSREILRAIGKVCEDFNYTDSFLYENFKKF